MCVNAPGACVLGAFACVQGLCACMLGVRKYEVCVRARCAYMQGMCEDHDDNTLLMVSRSLGDSGVHESFRYNNPQSASLDAFAVHGSVD